MPETLGSLCDKLTIVKLKQFHSDDAAKLESLSAQEKRLSDEIDSFVRGAMTGTIPGENLSFTSNKVYKIDGNAIREITGGIGVVFAELIRVNCELWHEQEKVYDFESVPDDGKNGVVKRLAILNLERNRCIDAIDAELKRQVEGR